METTNNQQQGQGVSMTAQGSIKDGEGWGMCGKMIMGSGASSSRQNKKPKPSPKPLDDNQDAKVMWLKQTGKNPDSSINKLRKPKRSFIS